MGHVFAFSLTAALNPSLLAAVTLMLTLTNPERLLLGYLFGAALMSVTCGLLLVFALPGTKTLSTTKHSIGPAIDITLGVLILAIVFVVATGRDRRRQAWTERRHETKKDKPPPRWKRTLSKGSPRDTFVIGILLSFPGVSYIAGMDLLSKQNIGTTATVVAVLAFNVIMLLLLELPLLGYLTRPESTAATVNRFSDLLTRHGGRVALTGAALIATWLIIRGALTLSS